MLPQCSSKPFAARTASLREASTGAQSGAVSGAALRVWSRVAGTIGAQPGASSGRHSRQGRKPALSASAEIINLSAILNLPKGTEHFISDIHGEYEAFLHILNSCSGVVKEKLDEIFDPWAFLGHKDVVFKKLESLEF